jgi:adenylosuccinate synthase
MGSKRTGIVVIGLGFGDEGKGSVVDLLSHYYSGANIVKYGGPEAAHHVVLPDGTTHCFSQYGSGTFQGAATFLSQYMIVNPFALEHEAEVLRAKKSFRQIYIHPDCRVVTPYHRLIGRARAISAKKSTVGMGVGPASIHGGLKSEILFKDLLDKKKLKAKLYHLHIETREAVALAAADSEDLATSFRIMAMLYDGLRATPLEDLVDWYQTFTAKKGSLWKDWSTEGEENTADYTIIESSQGALLDHEHGFYPHVAPVNIRDYENLITDFDEVIKIGVIRTYLTRHGSGPFVSEDSCLKDLPEEHNVSDKDSWQGIFRRGWLDLVMLKYALQVCGGVDGLFITHCDKFLILNKYSTVEKYWNYNGKSQETVNTIVSEIEYKERTLDERKQLTSFLEASYPAISNLFDMNSSNLLSRYLERELGVPVIGLSHGPTYQDKTCVLKEKF